MQALIDGDIIAYRCAASCQKQGVTIDPLEVGLARADELMHRILFETGSDSYRVFLSGGENFRHQIYPEYKANRKDIARPEYLQPIREHLISQWKAELAVDVEADDLLGIYQTDDTIICSIDKDLLMVEGKHYNFVKQEHYEVSAIGGIRHFYLQLIMGDRADNIPGYDGLMRQKVPKFLVPKITELEACQTEEEMNALVEEMYTDKAQYEINKRLLWILREPPMERGPVDESEV